MNQFKDSVVCCYVLSSLFASTTVVRCTFMSLFRPVCGERGWSHTSDTFLGSDVFFGVFFCCLFVDQFPPIAAASMWTRKDIKDFKDSIRKDADSVIKVGSGETVTVSRCAN